MSFDWRFSYFPVFIVVPAAASVVFSICERIITVCESSFFRITNFFPDQPSKEEESVKYDTGEPFVAEAKVFVPVVSNGYEEDEMDDSGEKYNEPWDWKDPGFGFPGERIKEEDYCDSK